MVKWSIYNATTGTLKNIVFEILPQSLVDTVKSVSNNHPWDDKIVAVVNRWFRGSLY